MKSTRQSKPKIVSVNSRKQSKTGGLSLHSRKQSKTGDLSLHSRKQNKSDQLLKQSKTGVQSLKQSKTGVQSLKQSKTGAHSQEQNKAGGLSLSSEKFLPSKALRTLLRKTAQKRWSSNMHRIRKTGLEILGPTRCTEFMKFAKENAYESFLKMFHTADGILSCVGTRSGDPCPFNFRINLSNPDELKNLRYLNISFDVDMKRTCEEWFSTVTKNSGWEGACDKSAIVQRLFKDVRFRCCRNQIPAHLNCHRVDLPNYETPKTLLIRSSNFCPEGKAAKKEKKATNASSSSDEASSSSEVE